MSEKVWYNEHEIWCDRANGLSLRCNCICSGYCDDIAELIEERDTLAEINKVLVEALDKIEDMDTTIGGVVFPCGRVAIDALTKAKEMGNNTHSVTEKDLDL